MKAKKGLIVGGVIVGALAVTAAGTAMYLKNQQMIPKGAEAVKNFDANRYLGKWYEIARLDFHFEKNLINATAEYSLNSDGSIKVVNSGYNIKKNKQETAEGKAKFRESPQDGKLKVSFFGPFYSGYNVIEIDPEYKYVFVAGRNLDYMWLLSRDKSIPENIKNTYLSKAREIGYNTDNLMWTQHKY